MSTRIVITEKTTAKRNFQLLDNALPANLSGNTIVLQLTDSTGAGITTTTAIEDANNGKVSYSPLSTDLVALNSPYRSRWKVTDGSGKVKYYPNGRWDEWEITKE